MKIAICDVDKSYLSYISVLLRQIRAIQNAEIIPYTNPRWCVSDLVSSKAIFDIVVLNRELGEYNGSMISSEIARIMPQCHIILITEENCIKDEDYDVRQMTILPKEHVPMRLVTVVERIAHTIYSLRESFFLVQSNRERIFLNCSSVYWMEKVLRKTEIVYKDTRISTYQTLSELLEQSQAECFAQCHRSIYVNLQNVFMIGTSEITMTNGARLPIGKTHKKDLVEAYDQYCRKLLSCKNHR